MRYNFSSVSTVMGVAAVASTANTKTAANVFFIKPPSIPQILVDQISQRSSIEITRDVVFEQRGLALPQHRRAGGRMRRDQHIRRGPQGTLRRQRLGIENVGGGSGDFPA